MSLKEISAPPIDYEDIIAIKKNDETDNLTKKCESWLKLITWSVTYFLIIVILIIILYRIINEDFKFIFTDLRFSDLLSLIMAIFAIALSIIFYLQAEKTSRTFYNYTYRFTITTSALLGRIEAGFTEKLRHLDEGQISLKERFDKIPYMNPETTKKEISEETRKLEKEVSERQKIIDRLLERSSLEIHEKENVISELKEKEKTIDEMKREISHLNRRLTHENENIISNENIVTLRAMMEYLRSQAPELFNMSLEQIRALSSRELKEKFELYINKFDHRFVSDLRLRHYLEANDKLTKEGVRFLIMAFRDRNHP
jgi:hypothetical protein